MPRGGARSRSGPAPDPNSERSERRNFTLTALPREGFRGEIPEWPLFVTESGVQHDVELQIWDEAWRSPEACAWSMWDASKWRMVAEMCRLAAIVETEPSASASLITQLIRYRVLLGMTEDGRRLNGWSIASENAPLKPVPDSVEEVPGQRRRSREMSA